MEKENILYKNDNHESKKNFGVTDSPGKISEYRELKRQLSSMNAIGKQLSDRFMIQKSIIDDVDSLPDERRGEVFSRYNDFLKSHQKEVAKAMNDRDRIVKSIERLRSDDEIAEAIHNIDTIDDATEYYRMVDLKNKHTLT